MKKSLITASLFIVLTLILISVTPVLAVPPLPKPFWGTVKVNGSNVFDGTHVRALINGVVYADTQSLTWQGDSVYSFLVPGDDPSTTGVIEGGVQGNTIVFTIDGVNADQTATWTSDGLTVNLNLTETPTVATLVSFSGKPRLNMVQLDWRTATEVDLVGFNVYRSESLNGVKQKQNSSLLAAHNPGQLVGFDYQFVDSVSQGWHYFYWLELVFTNTNNQSNPVDLTSNYIIYLPVLY